MINLTKLWTGAAQPADALRYGAHGNGDRPADCAPGSHASPARHARERKPIVVWNITRTCNLRCVHCYSHSQDKEYGGELTVKLEARLESEGVCSGTGEYAFAGGESGSWEFRGERIPLSAFDKVTQWNV